MKQILLDILVWYQGKGNAYRQETLLTDCVDDFLCTHKSPTYDEVRKRAIHQFNVAVVSKAVEVFESNGLKLLSLSKFHITDDIEPITNVDDFCRMFYGVGNLEWVTLKFSCKVEVDITADGKLLRVRVPQDSIQTSKEEKIKEFVQKYLKTFLN